MSAPIIIDHETRALMAATVYAGLVVSPKVRMDTTEETAALLKAAVVATNCIMAHLGYATMQPTRSDG